MLLEFIFLYKKILLHLLLRLFTVQCNEQFRFSKLKSACTFSNRFSFLLIGANKYFNSTKIYNYFEKSTLSLQLNINLENCAQNLHHRLLRLRFTYSTFNRTLLRFKHVAYKNIIYFNTVVFILNLLRHSQSFRVNVFVHFNSKNSGRIPECEKVKIPHQ